MHFLPLNFIISVKLTWALILELPNLVKLFADYLNDEKLGKQHLQLQPIYPYHSA